VWRTKLLKALHDFKPSTSSETAAELEVVIRDLDSALARLPEKEKSAFKALQIVLQAFNNLCSWIDASLKADAHPERFLTAAKGQAKLALEALDPVAFEVFSVTAAAALEQINAVTDWDGVTTVAAQLQKIPIPTIYVVEEPPAHTRRRNGEVSAPSEPKNTGPFVVKVMFDIERRPWSNSQILQAAVIYDLRAKLTVPTWPDGATHLILDYISTLSPDLLRISPLQANRRQDQSTDEFELHGHVQFPTPQNMLSDPLIIRVRATFFSEGGKEAFPATVIGYHQLRVRVSDKAHVPLLARYRAIDERNAQVIEEVQRTMPQLNAEHLNDFVEVLGAITNYMGVNLQQALYREGLVVSEADFQKNLLYHLRTWLGEEVREAPKQGGGPTDIQYKSVTVELKVEKEISNRRKIIEKYLSQPTQYSSASGAQLGILCVLDLTEKDKPPANPQNQITLETPEVHGFDSTLDFPTKIAAVIIDGNLRLPSSYSH
jgi:hypothetical protein